MHLMAASIQLTMLPSPPNKKACDYQQACYKLSDVDGHQNPPFFLECGSSRSRRRISADCWSVS
ncbi:hypothetical protein CO694_13545 [Salmonella enterica subsp. enterica serovar Paratyphi A]|nr:hypothetical protein CO694_13545 [Salmonella enterica subsp. enterica serovar Paratyphi A]